MNIRTSLLYILWVSTHIGALTAQNQMTVTEGSTAELNCTLPNVQSQTPYIVWSFNDKEVFERKGNEFEVAGGYEGRVDVPDVKLRNGDCTLVMKNVSRNDAGEYKSVLRSRITKRSAGEEKLIQRVKLIVEEATVPANNDGKHHGERHESSNDPGMKHPHLVIILLSVVMVTDLRLLL